MTTSRSSLGARETSGDPERALSSFCGSTACALPLRRLKSLRAERDLALSERGLADGPQAPEAPVARFVYCMMGY